MGCLEFIMSKNAEKLECAVIPKGSRVSVMGCSYLLLEDAKVDGNQTYLNDALKAQDNYDNDIDTTSDPDIFLKPIS